MKFLRRLCQFLAAAALIGFLLTFVVYSRYASRAQLVQRIEYNETNALLLGEPGPPIGSPQRMIIDDPKAFLEGEGPGGARLVNDVYLRQQGIYPLQLQTVGFIAGLARLALAGLLAVSLAGWWLTSRRLRSATGSRGALEASG
jgi:hypothetical protein